MSELHLLAMSYAAFMALIGAEIAWSAYRRDGRYRVGEGIVNIGHGVVFQVWDSFTKAWVMLPFLTVSAVVPWQTLPFDAPWAWLVGLLAYDFSSYWAHRHHHEVNLLWAIHGNHHAAEDFNLAAALRQAMLQNLFKWLWRLPLALLMPVEMFRRAHRLRLPLPIPPAHPVRAQARAAGVGAQHTLAHRVHHGRQARYLDRNYGGILIIWDRLFGTFQEEEEEPDYGITQPLNTLNAVWGNFELWARLVSATRRARGLDKVRVWLGSPARLATYAPGGPPVVSAPVENADVPLPMRIYVVVTGLGTPPLLGWMLLSGDGWPLGARVGLAGFILVSVVSAGALLEARPWAVPLELGRWAAAGVGASVGLGSLFLIAVAPVGWALVAAAVWRSRGPPHSARPGAMPSVLSR